MVRPFVGLGVFSMLALAACAQDVTPGPPSRTASPTCAFFQPAGGIAQPVLVLAAGSTLTEVLSDRTARPLFTFAAGTTLTDVQIYVDTVLARDGFVAAHALLDDPVRGVQHEVVLLDVAGTVVWHVVYANSTDPTLHLGAHGALAVDTNEGTLERMGSWVVGIDHVARNILGYSPLAAPASDGRVPARHGSIEGATPDSIGWIDPTSHAFLPLAAPMDAVDVLDGLAPRWLAGRLVYLTHRNGALSLISESPDSATRSIPMSLPAGDRSEVSIQDASPTGWVVVGRAGDAMFLRANVVTGEVAPFTVPSTGHSIRVLDGGDLVDTVASSTSSQLLRSSDLGATWVPLGLAVGTTPRIGTLRGIALAVGGETVLVDSTDATGFLSTPGPTQVLRHVGGTDGSGDLVTELAPPQMGADATNRWLGAVPSVRPDGACVTYWEVVNGRGAMRALDVGSGQRADLQVDPWVPMRFWVASALLAWL